MTIKYFTSAWGNTHTACESCSCPCRVARREQLALARLDLPRVSSLTVKTAFFSLFIYKISLHQAYKKNQIEHHRSLLRLHLGGCSRPPLGRSLGAMVEHAQKGWNTFVTGLLCCVKLLQTGRSCLFKTRGSLPELVYINQIRPSLRIQKS